MEVLSKEKIKPSSSTPPHLQKLNLSLLDQIAPPIYVHLIFFYELPNFDPSQVSQNLKKSLSNVLTDFPHLAGRIIQEDSFIDCNDEGVEYIETRVHSYMSETTKNPDPEDLRKYVPVEPHGSRSIPLYVQVNMFDCGGIAVAVCFLHKIADMQSFIFFMHAWAATCREGLPTIKPTFDLSSRFPPVDALSKFSSKPPPSKNETPQKELKKNGASEKVKNPTRIEAITAFILKNFTNSFSSKEKRNIVAIHVVNVRSKTSPPLRADSFGNACLQAKANWSKSEMNHVEYSDIEFNGLSTNKGNDLLEVLFTSWCRFPMYKVDYGWGKPHWVSTVGVHFKNLIVLMDTKCGDGIEAWMTMAEQDMAMIQTNYENLISHIII
ncbi:Vinorine synthase [Handroanthus impetiginosus]|uniref:Vinorine synthase n=1 Tax=Handroanthus impetiginosus TaxID=429701 RepID=A0A2G9FWN6_9LAMI|nr:Vinorine synthase [Handroanthus impetiginosus]